MCKNKQSIHYCTILSDEQWKFILEGRFSAQRQKCLHRLMTHAVRTKTVCNIKGIGIALEVGEVAASDVELAEYLGCNRKTVGKLIDSFNRLGVLTTRTNNRTSIHTLHFLTGWYVDGVLLTNPHYVKPVAVHKGQTDEARTPYSNDMLLENRQCSVPDACKYPRQDADSMAGGAASLSSLCSSVASESPKDRRGAEGKTDKAPLTGSNDMALAGNRPESPKEALDGTISDADSPDIGCRD